MHLLFAEMIYGKLISIFIIEVINQTEKNVNESNERQLMKFSLVYFPCV